MRLAIDSTVGDQVDAATANRAGVFICPFCLGPVQLFGRQSGAMISAHFRHEWGSKPEECENYQTAGGGLETRWLSSTRPPLILTATFGRVGKAGRLRLELFISPEQLSKLTGVAVNYDFDGSYRLIPAAALARQDYRVHVRPATVYQVRRQLVPYPELSLEGLAKDGPTIFTAGMGGRKLDPKSPLVLGHSYWVIAAVGQFPPPGCPLTCVEIPVDWAETWTAHRIEVLGDPEAICGWITDHLGRRLDPAPLGATLIHPPLAGVWPDGTVLLASGGPVVVRVDGADPRPATRLVVVRSATTDWTRHFVLERAPLPAFVCLGCLTDGVYDLLTRDSVNRDRVMRFRVVGPALRSPPSARVAGIYADGREELLHWFEPTANVLLTDVAVGRAALTRLEPPCDYPVLAPPSAPMEPGERLAWLARSGSTAWLDAGPYGRLETQRETPAANISLPPPLVARLRWLCGVARADSGTETAPAPWGEPDYSQIDQIVSTARLVVRTFLATSRWPIGLAAHVRAAWSALSSRLRRPC